MTHWAAQYIGTPWVAGESDCWHFARRVWRERFGVEVPAVPVDVGNPFTARRVLRDHVERAEWMQVDTPSEGDGVMMAKGARVCHVGIWVNGGVLHSVEGAGVVWTVDVRRLGYRVAGYYRRVTCAPQS